VLEVGAGGGQNFSWYVPAQVTRVEAVEPDEAMLAEARRAQASASVPITISQARAESLPFANDQFDSVVVTMVFCSVHDPARGLREIRRVLKPGGTLLLLEHVRSHSKGIAWLQDTLVPVTTRCLGNCHWNRDTRQLILDAGFEPAEVRELSGKTHSGNAWLKARPRTWEPSSAGSPAGVASTRPWSQSRILCL
jgi:ubiquinone/menaquinone biosynthesis C-methylase UbiE